MAYNVLSDTLCLYTTTTTTTTKINKFSFILILVRKISLTERRKARQKPLLKQQKTTEERMSRRNRLSGNGINVGRQIQTQNASTHHNTTNRIFVKTEREEEET